MITLLRRLLVCHLLTAFHLQTPHLTLHVRCNRIALPHPPTARPHSLKHAQDLAVACLPSLFPRVYR